MSITIDLSPAVVQEATASAESRNTTLERMISDALDAVIKRHREAADWKADFDKLVEETSRRRDAPYRFNRADAYEEVLA